MTGILLVHGAWHGPWCWDAFATRLTERGHQVRAVQLRGHHGPPGRIWHRVHVPPGGTIGAVARLAVHHPLVLLRANLLLRLKPFIGTPALVRELFFTPDTPQELVDQCAAHLQDESYPAFVDTMVVRPRPRRVRVPVLVMGAERDGIFTVGEVWRTARAYRTQAEIVSGMGHDMMLDQGWQQVADRIDAWTREVPLPGAARQNRP
jgi:pimeloyl-ACP methyl ester carboxylesterase